MDGQMRVPRRRCGVVAVNSRPVRHSARASPGKARDRPLRPSPYYYARRRLVADTRIANTSPDRIDGFLKVTPGAIRNIARGLSLHFRTVNIRSIVVESGALIENTRGVSQGEAPSRYRPAVPGNTAPRASNIARDDIINARVARECLTGNFTESRSRRVIFARLARVLPPPPRRGGRGKRGGAAACPMNQRVPLVR